MSQFFQIHAETPQARLIRQAAELLRGGAVAVYPTDSGYALGCTIGDKDALERIRQIRRLDERHNFTLVCRDLSDLATYAKVDNTSYRLMKKLTPGPYTFILPATPEVPRRLMHPKKRTVGVRIPDHVFVQALLDTLGEPLLTSTLTLPGEDEPRSLGWGIQAALDHHGKTPYFMEAFGKFGGLLAGAPKIEILKPVG